MSGTRNQLGVSMVAASSNIRQLSSATTTTKAIGTWNNSCFVMANCGKQCIHKLLSSSKQYLQNVTRTYDPSHRIT